jgi:DNA-binding NarL/FixJ family response regulator
VPSPDQSGCPLLVVDDDLLFVRFISTLLESAGYRTLTASSGEEGLALARQHSPEVVLLDIQLPRLNGYEVCRALRNEMGDAVAIAFVSGSRTETIDISAGLLVGADDFLVKPCDPSELLARVGALRRRVRSENGNGGASSRSLTTRELEILRLLSEGLNQKEIAKTLSISPKTVGVHIEHILGKLDVHSRAQAVAAAYRENLLSPSH